MPQNSQKLYLYAPQTPDLKGFSGDRTFLKLFTHLFQDVGFQVAHPSVFMPKDNEGNLEFQRQAIRLAEDEVAAILSTYPRPDIFVTYHHYYKAPDLIGPRLVEAWDCPYMIIEASHAPKRMHGPWQIFAEKTMVGLEAATVLLTINPDDTPMLRATPYASKVRAFKPFMPPLSPIELSRNDIAEKHGLNPAVPWLLVVAQMRARNKLPSYEFLGEALGHVAGEYELLVIGEGTAMPEIKSLFSHAHFLGVIPQPTLFSYYAAADILAWPGLHEAIGMCYIEAQAYGCVPVMMEMSGGRHVIEPGKTGLIARDAVEYAGMLQELINDPARCKIMGEAAIAYVARVHGWARAVVEMRGVISEMLKKR